MSSPRNVVKVEKERVSEVPVDTATSFNSGDMMKWDATNHVATPVVTGDAASDAAAALFIGVSNDTNPIPSLNQKLVPPRITIVTRAICEFTADDYATYYPGDAVTFGSDPQKVHHTGASAGCIIGYVAPETPGFTVSGGATVGISAVKGTTKLLIALRPQFTYLVTI